MASWAAQPIDLGLGLGSLRPLVLGPASVPELTDPVAAVREPELAVLSAVAHGNGSHGIAVLEAALVALARLDREHAAVYFEVVWNALRGPVQNAVEALIMERRTEGEGTLLPSQQWLVDIGKRAGKREGLREALLGLLAQAGIPLAEEDRTRIDDCKDAATLDRWIKNVLGAKTAADVLS